MKRARLSLAAALAIACGLSSAVSAAGVTICNSNRGVVGFVLGYVRANGLESTGPFESAPGKCATFLTNIAKGPFYLYAEDPTGAMAWTANGEETGQAFCLSREPHFVSRNNDHIKDGKLACPADAVRQFMLVPNVPRGRPKFTFSENNADRPSALSAAASTAASSKQETITCPFLKEGRVTFAVPAKLGAMPTGIDFDYPAKATGFSFRDGNLFLIAMDESEPSRVRIVISAQLNKKSGTYEGQIFVDMGGNQLMRHNGPVRCTVGPA